jgi:hypothetical protein
MGIHVRVNFMTSDSVAMCRDDGGAMRYSRAVSVCKSTVALL